MMLAQDPRPVSPKVAAELQASFTGLYAALLPVLGPRQEAPSPPRAGGTAG
jgi:hypothetical protein